MLLVETQESHLQESVHGLKKQEVNTQEEQKEPQKQKKGTLATLVG